MFIKATATGNTINGLNDEINKRPEAGHGGALQGLCWPGRHCWAQPQACLPAASLPCPSPPAHPPRPSLALGPPPPSPAPAPPPLGETRPTRLLLQDTARALPPRKRLCFHHPKAGTLGPPSSLSPQNVQCWCQSGSVWGLRGAMALRGWTQATTLSTSCPGVGLADPGSGGGWAFPRC